MAEKRGKAKAWQWRQVAGLPVIELVWAALFLAGVVAMMALAIWSSVTTYQ